MRTVASPTRLATTSLAGRTWTCTRFPLPDGEPLFTRYAPRSLTSGRPDCCPPLSDFRTPGRPDFVLDTTPSRIYRHEVQARLGVGQIECQARKDAPFSR